ncbi:hypothetical protein SSBR45G_08290 [Bradyrhizobium sp. SSBR45G]|uniref:hypothetical protein n=1 Tax=unclassified Bradyrhizobium TaxID=2631580 RepID=UPI002342AD9E|nr:MULTISPECIES: hypothetical protein [unclassified Bradyrhizobium]GLH75921.1 hypothetical protein SSBR45G_08290 [Bradyrhizobium sp. SSBR45G]GLH85158.1 hypothetical protein SSBR45R_26180 [Bradyrhizobium sp. SSBR45R]
MRLLAFALLALILDFSIQTAPARAQAKGDLDVAAELKEHPGYSVLIFNIDINMDGKRRCLPDRADMSNEQKQWAVAKLNREPLLDLESVFGHDRGAVLVLPPGTWTVSQFSCGPLKFDGAIVQIKVAPGEIVNAGHVMINRVTVDPGKMFERARKIETHIKIEELPKDSVASLKTRAPETFAKAKRRSFAVNAALL